MAKKIRDGLLRGNAREYQLSTGDFIIVSRVDTHDHGDEVMVFPSNGRGEVADWGELYCARAERGDDMSDAAALAALGESID